MTKHPVVDLTIGSKGPYDVCLLTGTGDQILRPTGMAELHDHVPGLRVTLTLVAHRREHILLGFARLVLSGRGHPYGCFDLLIPIHWRTRLSTPVLAPVITSALPTIHSQPRPSLPLTHDPRLLRMQLHAAVVSEIGLRPVFKRRHARLAELRHPH
jgi:hypothetical protein